LLLFSSSGIVLKYAVYIIGQVHREEVMMRAIGMAVLLASAASFAFAGVSAPEIDGSSGVAAIGLLAGGLLVLRSRKKRS
jgi:hypothetical protein